MTIRIRCKDSRETAEMIGKLKSSGPENPHEDAKGGCRIRLMRLGRMCRKESQFCGQKGLIFRGRTRRIVVEKETLGWLLSRKAENSEIGTK